MRGLSFANETVNAFIDDDCANMAASLAYYTIFSLPPLLVLIVTIAGFTFDEEVARGRVYWTMRELMGAQSANLVRTTVLTASERLSASGPWAFVGLAALLFSATTAFHQLQLALNRVWSVEPDPAKGGVRNFIMKRVLSSAMLFSLGLALLISLVATAFVQALAVSGAVRLLNLAGTVLLSSVAFTVIFRVLPDAVVRLRDAAIGGVFTALLFAAGRSLIGLYLGAVDLGSVYGSAGSLVLILFWFYLAGCILLLGAEFTRHWAAWRGQETQPVRGAVRVVRKLVPVEGAQSKWFRRRRRRPKRIPQEGLVFTHPGDVPTIRSAPRERSVEEPGDVPGAEESAGAGSHSEGAVTPAPLRPSTSVEIKHGEIR